LTSTGPAAKLFLLPPTLAWGSRADAVLQVAPGTTGVPYVATASGPHGLVIVNEDGTSGSYSFRVYTLGAVAVDPGPPATTDFTGLSPNPAWGPTRIQFALHEPGLVGFEVIDATGRRVAEVPSHLWSPGRWSTAWDGRGRDGSHLASGIYFVRMIVNGRAFAL